MKKLLLLLHCLPFAAYAQTTTLIERNYEDNLTSYIGFDVRPNNPAFSAVRKDLVRAISNYGYQPPLVKGSSSDSWARHLQCVVWHPVFPRPEDIDSYHPAVQPQCAIQYTYDKIPGTSPVQDYPILGQTLYYNVRYHVPATVTLIDGTTHATSGGYILRITQAYDTTPVGDSCPSSATNPLMALRTATDDDAVFELYDVNGATIASYNLNGYGITAGTWLNVFVVVHYNNNGAGWIKFYKNSTANTPVFQLTSKHTLFQAKTPLALTFSAGTRATQATTWWSETRIKQFSLSK